MGQYLICNQSGNITVDASKQMIRPTTAAVSSEAEVETMETAKGRYWKAKSNTHEAGEPGLISGVLLFLMFQSLRFTNT